MNFRHLLLPAAVAAAAATSVAAQTTVFNPVADTWVYYGTGQLVNHGTEALANIYALNTAREAFAYYRFDLSGLPTGATITDASLTFYETTGGIRGDIMTTARFAAYGLNDVAGNTAQNWDETTLTFNNRGSEWTAVNSFDLTTRLTSFDGASGNELVSDTSTTAGAASISGTNLAAFLNTRLAGGGLATFVIDQPGVDAGRGYALGTRESAAGVVPVLNVTYSAIPEPSTYAVVFGAGTLGFVALRRRLRR
ncbi:MAG TPA: DNRLRE domain-containing protein [Opitutaceae bacterium]|nr:DNRLRE domain-containing protein [Opitutaceae bacterium]